MDTATLGKLSTFDTSRLVALGSVKAFLSCGRYVIVPISQLISLGFGVGLIFLGSELVHFNPSGPLRIFQHQNLVGQNKFKALGRALNIVGGVLVYSTLDYFFLYRVMIWYDDYFSRVVAELVTKANSPLLSQE